MAQRQRDPGRLEGEALKRWYQRPVSEAEAERQASARLRHLAFFGAPKTISQAGSTPVGTGDQVTPKSMPGPRSPIDMAQDALRDFQNGPKIQRPNLAESFIPVIGPAWEAVADVQDGHYGAAAFNGAMAIGDLLPVGAAIKGVKAAEKGIGILKKGSVTAGAAAKKIKRAGLVTTGQEIHHTIPLKGLSRSAQDWRNHYALLKVMPRASHRRLTGRWGDAPRFNSLERLWHGTTDWQKSVPAALGAYAADSWENLAGPFDPPTR